MRGTLRKFRAQLVSSARSATRRVSGIWSAAFQIADDRRAAANDTARDAPAVRNASRDAARRGSALPDAFFISHSSVPPEDNSGDTITSATTMIGSLSASNTNYWIYFKIFRSLRADKCSIYRRCGYSLTKMPASGIPIVVGKTLVETAKASDFYSMKLLQELDLAAATGNLVIKIYHLNMAAQYATIREQMMLPHANVEDPSSSA